MPRPNEHAQELLISYLDFHGQYGQDAYDYGLSYADHFGILEELLESGQPYPVFEMPTEDTISDWKNHGQRPISIWGLHELENAFMTPEQRAKQHIFPWYYGSGWTMPFLVADAFLYFAGWHEESRRVEWVVPNSVSSCPETSPLLFGNFALSALDEKLGNIPSDYNPVKNCIWMSDHLGAAIARCASRVGHESQLKPRSPVRFPTYIRNITQWVAKNHWCEIKLGQLLDTWLEVMTVCEAVKVGPDVVYILFDQPTEECGCRLCEDVENAIRAQWYFLGGEDVTWEVQKSGDSSLREKGKRLLIPNDAYSCTLRIREGVQMLTGPKGLYKENPRIQWLLREER
ncbi:MAG: hypothetical protein ABIG95_03240 [Candidatus Woesearchaeota archaeon]